MTAFRKENLIVSENEKYIFFIKTDEFSKGSAGDQTVAEAPEPVFVGMKGLLSFPGARYPLIVCVGHKPDHDASSVLFSVSLNMRCRESYRSTLQMLLLTMNLTSLENLWFRLDRSGDLYVSTEITIWDRYPTNEETEMIIKNLFAAASDYLIDIDTVISEPSDSAEQKKVLDRNFKYYWGFKTQLPSLSEKEPLTETAFRCFPGFSFSDWINKDFDPLE